MLTIARFLIHLFSPLCRKMQLCLFHSLFSPSLHQYFKSKNRHPLIIGLSNYQGKTEGRVTRFYRKIRAFNEFIRRRPGVHDTDRRPPRRPSRTPNLPGVSHDKEHWLRPPIKKAQQINKAQIIASIDLRVAKWGPPWIIKIKVERPIKVVTVGHKAVAGSPRCLR